MGLSENRLPQFQQIHIIFIQTKAIDWAYPIFWHNHIDIYQPLCTNHMLEDPPESSRKACDLSRNSKLTMLPGTLRQGTYRDRSWAFVKLVGGGFQMFQISHFNTLYNNIYIYIHSIGRTGTVAFRLWWMMIPNWLEIWKGCTILAVRLIYS